jgi:hypothetical protein
MQLTLVDDPMRRTTLVSFVDELEKIANVFRDIGMETADLVKRLGGTAKAMKMQTKAVRAQDRAAVRDALKRHERLQKGHLLPMHTTPNNPVNT